MKCTVFLLIDQFSKLNWNYIPSAYNTSTNPRGVTAGWTTNEITITADAVLNFETFKCAIKDTDTLRFIGRDNLR